MTLSRAIAAAEQLDADELDVLARVCALWADRLRRPVEAAPEPRRVHSAPIAADRPRTSSAERMARKRALERQRSRDAESVTPAVTSDASAVTSDARSDARTVTCDAPKASHRVAPQALSRPSEPSELSGFLELKTEGEKREGRRAREGVTPEVTPEVTLASAVTRDQQRVTEVRRLVSAAYRERKLGVPAAVTDLTGQRGVAFATWAQEQEIGLLREQLEAFFADSSMRSKGWPFPFFMSNPGESLARSKRAAPRASNMLSLTDVEEREGQRRFLRAGLAHDPQQLAEYEAQWAEEDRQRSEVA